MRRSSSKCPVQQPGQAYSLALRLYACSLFDDQHTHAEPSAREDAGDLLDVLTPVVRSWPARYGAVASDMAIQVLGGAGYTREYPLEQLYPDQRLTMIHEGAEAIHGIDRYCGKLQAMRFFFRWELPPN